MKKALPQHERIHTDAGRVFVRFFQVCFIQMYFFQPLLQILGQLVYRTTIINGSWIINGINGNNGTCQKLCVFKSYLVFSVHRTLRVSQRILFFVLKQKNLSVQIFVLQQPFGAAVAGTQGRSQDSVNSVNSGNSVNSVNYMAPNVRVSLLLA